MGIQLTENAARHVQSMLTRRGGAVGLRVGTRKSGCSGFAYEVDYAEEVRPDDVVFESQGVKIVVNSGSLPHLEGTQIDFVKTNLLNEGFEFRNPNIKDTCGCGESFSV